MTQEGEMPYPDEIGVVAYKNGDYDVFPHLAHIPPCVKYIRADLASPQPTAKGDCDVCKGKGCMACNGVGSKLAQEHEQMKSDYYDLQEAHRQMGIGFDHADAHHEVHHTVEAELRAEIEQLKAALQSQPPAGDVGEALERIRAAQGEGHFTHPDIVTLMRYAQNRPHQEELPDVVQFLLGQKALDGVWYGEKVPQGYLPFWWRNKLRALYPQSKDETQ